MILENQQYTVVLIIIFSEVQSIPWNLEHIEFELGRLEFSRPFHNPFLVLDGFIYLDDYLVKHLIKLFAWDLLVKVSTEFDDESGSGPL